VAAAAIHAAGRTAYAATRCVDSRHLPLLVRNTFHP